MNPYRLLCLLGYHGLAESNPKFHNFSGAFCIHCDYKRNDDTVDTMNFSRKLWHLVQTEIRLETERREISEAGPKVTSLIARDIERRTNLERVKRMYREEEKR